MKPADEARSWTDELREIVTLAWPAVLSQLGMMLMGVVDLLLVGRLGEDAMASVGLGTTWSFGTAIVVLGAASGLDPLLAQAFGAGDRAGAGRTMIRGGAMLLLMMLPVALLHLVAGPGLRWMNQPAAVIPDADLYCRLLIPSLPAMVLFNLVRQTLQADGRMFPAAVAVIVGNVFNLVVAWALVYGHLGAPPLGVAGVGVATTLGRWVMLAVIAWMGRDLLREIWPRMEGILSTAAIGQLLAVGLPVGFQVGLEVWAFTASTLLVGAFGPTAVAAHMVALNLASLSFMVPMGISAAAATRVGNLLGAGHPWSRAGWTALGLGVTVMSMSALVFASFPTALARLYAPTDPAVVAMAATLLPLAAIFQLFDGTQVVCFGVLRGAGDTRMPALANLIGYYALGLPIGTWLAFHGWGPQGQWVGLVIGLAVVAGLLVLRLRWTAARGGFRVAPV